MQNVVETQAWIFFGRVRTGLSGVVLLFQIFLQEDEVHSFDAVDASAR